MKTLFKTTLGLLGLALAFGTFATTESTTSNGIEVAARYHLRQRTQRFFERSTPAGREAQQGIYQSLPKPASQRPCPTGTTVG